MGLWSHPLRSKAFCRAGHQEPARAAARSAVAGQPWAGRFSVAGCGRCL